MALAESYRELFQDEARKMTISVVKSLQQLKENPSDKNEVERLLNCADVIIGDAKFLEDKELEEGAKIIINLFKGTKDARWRSTEICRLLERFSKFAQ